MSEADDTHKHCITPCDQIRIQADNHNAYLDMRSRAEAAEAKLVDAIKALDASDKLASWALCARKDRRVESDGEPMAAQTLKWTEELLRLAEAQQDARVLR